MSKIMYPGSFDPITKGHMNLIDQASELFDEVVIAVLVNSNKKNAMFTLEERVRMIEELYRYQDNIKVVYGEGAAVDVAILNGCKALLRGLRGLSDYDYEVTLAQVNKEISHGEVNSVCLFADKEYQFLSSSIVKEVFGLGKDVSLYVDPYVVKQMKLKQGERDGK